MATSGPKVSECPICSGTGWKNSSVDSNVRSVERCDCRIMNRAAWLLKQAQIPERYSQCTLDNFDVKFHDASNLLNDALFRARGFVQNYERKMPGMLLYGRCGTGKTHLASAILRDLIISKGAEGLFRGYSALLKQIQETYRRDIVVDEETSMVITEYSIVQDVIQTEVLVLDDLGAEKSTEWTLSMLYHIINERYNHRRTTIITTNVPWEDTESRAGEGVSDDAETPTPRPRVATLRRRISERTFSRIQELCPLTVPVDGIDYRRNKSGRRPFFSKTDVL